MKKVLLVLSFALLATVSVWAQTFTADNLTYKVTDAAAKTVELTGYETEPTGKLDIPATVSYEGSEYSVTEIGDEAFAYCENLTELVVPPTVTIIGQHAFHYNRQFTKIVVHATTPPLMRQDAFANTELSTPVYVPAESLEAYKATPYWEEFTNIQAYDPNRFNVDGLRYEITDESAKEVELVGAIVTLTGKLDIPTTVTHNDISYTVTSVGDEAFAFDSDLTELVFPHTVEYIGDHAFHYCTELTKITTYATVPPYVGTQAFAGADKEIPVIVPFNSINAYKAANGWSEFTNIRSTFVIDNLRLQLTDATAKEVSVVGYVMLPPTGKLEIPETVDYYGESYTITYIGDDSFADCTKLTELILPKTVTGVGARAFFDNAAFKRMTIHAVVPPFMGDEAFAAADFSTPLYVPEEGYDDYLNADGWKYFDVQVIQSSVSTLVMPESIRVYGGMLRNPEAHHFIVYDLTGRIIYSGNATTLSLTPGIYVVSCNGANGKVVF